MTRGLALALVLAAAPVAADEGEFSFAATGALEAATLRHPLAKIPPGVPLAPFTVLPRAMLGARFGVTNEFQLGLALDAAATANVPTDNVVVGGTAARLVTGTYFELAMPATVAWRVDSGYDLSAVATFEAGPMVALWTATAATDPAKPNGDGLPRRLPLEITDTINAGVEARLAIALETRLFTALGLRCALYAAAGWAGFSSVRIGLLFEPSWIASGGPL